MLDEIASFVRQTDVQVEGVFGGKAVDVADLAHQLRVPFEIVGHVPLFGKFRAEIEGDEPSFGDVDIKIAKQGVPAQSNVQGEDVGELADFFGKGKLEKLTRSLGEKAELVEGKLERMGADGEIEKGAVLRPSRLQIRVSNEARDEFCGFQQASRVENVAVFGKLKNSDRFESRSSSFVRHFSHVVLRKKIDF